METAPQVSMPIQSFMEGDRGGGRKTILHIS